MYSAGADEHKKMNPWVWLGIALLVGGIIAIIVILATESFDVGYNNQYNPSPINTGYAQGVQVTSDYIGDNMLNQPILMPKSNQANYLNMMYPPESTKFHGAHKQCAVSGDNNCPTDLYWKCANNKWTKEAVGEALALSSVGSYYVPSPVEDRNMHEIIKLAHDPVTHDCASAGLHTNPIWGGLDNRYKIIGNNYNNGSGSIMPQ